MGLNTQTRLHRTARIYCNLVSVYSVKGPTLRTPVKQGPRANLRSILSKSFRRSTRGRSRRSKKEDFISSHDCGRETPIQCQADQKTCPSPPGWEAKQQAAIEKETPVQCQEQSPGQGTMPKPGRRREKVTRPMREVSISHASPLNFLALLSSLSSVCPLLIFLILFLHYKRR